VFFVESFTRKSQEMAITMIQ